MAGFDEIGLRGREGAARRLDLPPRRRDDRRLRLLVVLARARASCSATSSFW